MRKQSGKIHIYTGDGKGKTTASVGLAVRAAGSDLKVLYTQFLKDGNSSEFKILRHIPQMEIFPGPVIKKFVFQMKEEEKAGTRAQCSEYFAKIVAKVEADSYDMLILDEIIGTINMQMLPLETLIRFLEEKPARLETVLTGRDPQPALLDLADYVSKIVAVKHPYDTEKLAARPGIEF